MPGNSKSLWTAVKIAKDTGCAQIPNNMNLKGVPVVGSGISDCFAKFFDEKVKNIVGKVKIDENVYNGNRKIVAGDLNFMTKQDIIECVKMLKMKNSEGYDRIPQRILIDEVDHLIDPLSKLFSMIYNSKSIPGQWLVAKITPIHKKGSIHSIENYRPVAGLCSTSKIFERLILRRIAAIKKIARCVGLRWLSGLER